MTTIYVTEESDGSCSVTLRNCTSAALKAAVELLKDYISPIDREYDPETRKWCISPDARVDLEEWLELMTARRAVIEWAHESDRKRSPYSVLHLLPSAPPELVKSAYKTLSLLHHPDRGGSHDRQIALNEAFENISRGLK